MLVSSSHTSRDGGSRSFLASVDTSRESGGEEVASRSNTSGEDGSRFPSIPFHLVRGESKYSLVAGERDNGAWAGENNSWFFSF